jgi:NAD+ synthase
MYKEPKSIEQLKSRFSNVQSVQTDLTAVFETFKQSVPHSIDEASSTFQQTRVPRIRMTTLYYLAGIHGLS